MRGAEAKVKAFIESKGIRFPQVMDLDGSISASYVVVGIPCSVLIDKEGIVREIMVGSSTGQMRALKARIEELAEGPAPTGEAGPAER
jgi:hypothetical protein